jgi:hypothetical protein
MVEDAAQDARAKIVAALCFQKFIEAEGAEANLDALKTLSTWKQNQYVRDGGWVSIEGLPDPSSKAAALCARKLAALDSVNEAITTQSISGI